MTSAPTPFPYLHTDERGARLHLDIEPNEAPMLVAMDQQNAVGVYIEQGTDVPLCEAILRATGSTLADRIALLGLDLPTATASVNAHGFNVGIDGAHDTGRSVALVFGVWRGGTESAAIADYLVSAAVYLKAAEVLAAGPPGIDS